VRPLPRMALVLNRVAPHQSIEEQLEQAEEERKVAELNSGDKDGDQRLDWDEFVAMVRKKEPKITNEVLKARFKELDKNGDGSISWNEYMRAHSPLQKAVRFLKGALVRKILRAVILFGVYTLLGVLGFTYFEEQQSWTAIDAFYFSMMTMSTVGYGDISPSNDASRGFTLFMIVIGVVFVFVEVANVVGSLTSPITSKGRALLEKAFPMIPVDLDGDGGVDYYKPRPPLIYYSKNLLPSFMLTMGVQFACAAVFQAIDPKTFFIWFYHCLVTAFTVGYGDVPNPTQAGRMWGSIHIILSVAMLGELISTFGELRKQRAATLSRVAQLDRELDQELLDQVSTHTCALCCMRCHA